MNPLSLIPAGAQVYVRIVLLVALVAIGGVVGWTVNGWRLGTDLQALKAEHAQTVSDAYKASQAAQAKADADHAKLAADLAQSSAAYHEDLTRSEHANDLLRADVASGTRVVRVAATCPAGAAGLPQAAASGRVDPGAGAVLDPAAGQAVLDLRSRITASETQLAACQAAVIRITGQPRPAPATTQP